MRAFIMVRNSSFRFNHRSSNLVQNNDKSNNFRQTRTKGPTNSRKKKFDEEVAKMLSTTRNCSDKICTLNFEIVDTCFIFTKRPESVLCDVPCVIEDCKKEIFYNVNCPIWTCVFKPTTTSSTTTTTGATTTSSTFGPLTTSSPEPLPGTDCNSLCITAWTFSIIFAFALILLAIMFVKNNRILRTLNRRLNSDYRELGESAPIIRGYSERDEFGFENVPLRADLSNESRNRTLEAETSF